MCRPSPRLSSTSRPKAGVGRTGGAWFQDWKLRRRPQLVADGSLGVQPQKKGPTLMMCAGLTGSFMRRLACK